jgi:CBS domain-containing protein
MVVNVVHMQSPVSALVNHPAFSISPDESLAFAARAMQAENVSALLVGPGVNAIVTERDVTRAIGAGCSPMAPVADSATPLPVTVGGSTDILEVAALMLNQEIRHVVVELEDGSIGIVSLRTIMAVLLQAAQPKVWLSALREQVTFDSGWAVSFGAV